MTIPFSLNKYTKPAIAILSRYALVCFFVVFASLSGYLIVKVGDLSQAEPTQDQIDDKISKAKSIQVDTGALSTLSKLKDRESEINSQFDKSRNNPFED